MESEWRVIANHSRRLCSSTLRPVRSRWRRRTARARQAEAQVKQAQAQLDQAKLNLSYTKIVAPAAGIITRKSVEVNQNVSVGPKSAHAGFARGYLGDCELQRDAVAQNGSRTAGRDSRRFNGQRLQGQGHADRWRDWLGACRSSRPRTRPATTSRWCSAFRCASTLLTLKTKIPTSRSGRDFRLNQKCG